MSDFQPDIAEISRAIGVLNGLHFCVFVGASYVIAYKKPVSGTDDFSIIYMRERDFLLMYKNKKIQTGEVGTTGAPKYKTWAELWLQSPYRLNFNSVVFKPTSEVYEDEFNLWNGFNIDHKKMEKAEITGCPLFLEFVMEIISNGSERMSDYILDWCADAVQNPENKQGVALVLKSKIHGTGKTFFCNYFGRIFGKHYMLAAKQESILGRFSGHLEYNIILGAEEAVFAKNKKAENELKDMITSNTRNVERKGIEIEIGRQNYTRVIFMSNENHVMSIDISDRRFQVVDVSTDHAKDKPYFDKIEKEWFNGGRESFLKMLQARNISRLNLEDSRIINIETIEQRFLSMPEFEKWLFQVLDEGGLTGYQLDIHGNKDIFFYELKDGHDTEIDSDQFYDNYVEFCKTVKSKQVRTKQELSRQIKKIIPMESKERVREGFKRITPWCFPPLIEMRRLWSLNSHINHKWTHKIEKTVQTGQMVST